jgi:hypothetical protein
MIDHVMHAARIQTGYAKQLLEGIPNERFTEQIAEMPNHPAWICGHLALSLDLVCDLLGAGREISDDWQALFGMGSQPSADPNKYPEPAVVVEALNSQLERATASVAKATPAELSRAAPEHLRDFLPTVGDAAVFLLVGHLGVHLGQLSAWRRAAGLDFALPLDRDLARANR